MGLDIEPHQREKLERLCRYVSRPPVATERLAMRSSGQVRYQLKTPYRDGTTHIHGEAPYEENFSKTILDWLCVRERCRPG